MAIFSVAGILLLAALLMTLWHAAKGQIALWVPVLLVEIVLLLQYLPLR